MFHSREAAKGDMSRAAVEILGTNICGKTNGFGISDKYAGGGEGISSSFFAYTQTLSNGCMATHEKWLAQAAAYLATMVDRVTIAPELGSLAGLGDKQKWSREATDASSGRKFAQTTKGYYVMGPGVMEEGDVVCVLLGGKMPFCLRFQPFGATY